MPDMLVSCVVEYQRGVSQEIALAKLRLFWDPVRKVRPWIQRSNTRRGQNFWGTSSSPPLACCLCSFFRLSLSFSSTPRTEVAVPRDQRLFAYIPFQPALAACLIPCAGHAPGMSTGSCRFLRPELLLFLPLPRFQARACLDSRSVHRDPDGCHNAGILCTVCSWDHLLSRRGGGQFPGELLHKQPPVFLARSPLLCVLV